jgi:tryptophan-rich sensory protein
MFTPGQLIFAILFVIVFVTAMIYVYRKDLSWQKEHYQGTRWVLLGFFLFILFLFFVKFFLKN